MQWLLNTQIYAGRHVFCLSFAIGKGMDYMPGAASLAATHKGKVQNLCLAALWEKHQGLPAEACILGLEKATKEYNAEQAKATGDQPHLAEYQALGISSAY